jgi:hypothetical protein
MKPIHLLISAILLSPIACPAALVGYTSSGYYQIDPSSGSMSLIANGGSGSITNTIFAINGSSDVAYRLSGTNSLISTNLSTGITINTTLSQSPEALGIFNGNLISYTSSGYYQINPSSGTMSFIASGGSGSITNTIFTIDSNNGIAYRISGFSGNVSLTATNLVTGTSSSVHLTQFPEALGIFNGNLIGYTSSGYYQIDPFSGTMSFVASGGSGSITNTIFTIDPNTGVAYRVSGSSGNASLIATNLSTGTSSSAPLSHFPDAIGTTITPVPEPNTLLFAFGLFVFVAIRIRMRSGIVSPTSTRLSA